MLSSYWVLRRGVYLSAIDLLPGLHRDAELLAVLTGFEPDPGRLAVRRRDRDLGNVHRCRTAIDAALRVHLVGLAVARGDVDAVDHDLAVLRQDLGDRTGAALVLARKHDDLVALLDLGGA